LSDCPAQQELVLGDARLAMQNELDRGAAQNFDVLAIAAFSSDSIPTHLLTLEAIDAYLAHLKPDGILAVHISSRHFDLRPVLNSICEQRGLASREVIANSRSEGVIPSVWALLSRRDDVFQASAFRNLPTLSRGRSVRWTDDYCSVFAVLNPLHWDRLFLNVNTSENAFLAHYQRGAELLQQHKLDQAEAEFRKAISIDGSDAGAWVHLGNVYRAKSRTAEAVQCYQRAVKLNPNSADAYNNLGGMLSSSDPARAYEYFYKALQLDPQNGHAHNNLANLLARQGKLQEAIEQYEQALTIAPDLETASRNLEIVRKLLTEQEQESHKGSD
jgi:tetratricopeptide (TPR) repeat protein